MRRGLLPLLFLALGTTVAFAGDATYEGDGWHMTLPDGWVRIKQARLDTATRVIHRQTSMRPEAGFQLDEARETLVYPYVLVQHHPKTAAVYDDLVFKVNDTKLSFRPDDARAAWQADADTREPIVDKGRHRMLEHHRLDAKDGAVRAVRMCKLGADGVIEVRCLARVETWDAHRATFAQVIDSVRFAKGRAYGEEPGLLARHGGLLVVLLLLGLAGTGTLHLLRTRRAAKAQTWLAPRGAEVDDDDDGPWRSGAAGWAGSSSGLHRSPPRRTRAPKLSSWPGSRPRR